MSKTLVNDTEFEFKAINGAISVDEAKGIVECFVAGIGNKDSVGDIVAPGAFDASLKRRKPRVVWGHDWNQPIGKVLEMYEVRPNDPRLPAKMKQAGIGGLYARVQFNLKSERGREAFANVLFFGEDQEWSIGYKTLDAIYDSARQANILKEVELYECSPVLHGANQLTGTISIKSENQDMTSMRQSKWKMFDRDFAAMVKDEYPEIWNAGGNIKGDDQYEILTKIADQNGVAKTDSQIEAIKLREAWIARHKDDFLLPGVIAQIKWLAVGSRGEAHMKKVVREAIKKQNSEKSHMGMRMGMGMDETMMNGNDPIMYPKMVGMALSGKFGGAIRLRQLDKNIVVFDQMIEGKVYTWRVSYHFDGSQFMFGDPEKVKATTIFMPEDEGDNESEYEGEEDESEEGSEEEDSDEKAGAGPCWPGYVMVGMKRGKNGEMVPNCVPMKGMGMPTEDEEEDILPMGMGQMKGYLTDDVYTDGKAAPVDAIPQERFTGDVLRGRGPRRGNLERLLRYWRPIMRREGGFRRCRVILADHPELYPLNNICAWLHHETTGLWPNEGCHHPGMKNCRRKLRNVVRGSIVSDSAFESRMRELAPGKSAMGMGQMMDEDVTDEDIMYANKVLSEFMQEEKEFMKYLADEKNWTHMGDDEDGNEAEHEWLKPESMKGPGDCGCGCGGSKSDSDVSVKARNSISNVNTEKIQQAISLLQSVVSPAVGPLEMKKKQESIEDFLAPVIEYHDIKVDFVEGKILVKNYSLLTSEAINALSSAINAFEEEN